ncbi:uncharacterized protein [Narcine bancroftii]|uniref:uncharacterized protein n=1 Tax=Narcine bancroftii TaxID=1343680 RepID=UPI0038321B32
MMEVNPNSSNTEEVKIRNNAQMLEILPRFIKSYDKVHKEKSLLSPRREKEPKVPWSHQVPWESTLTSDLSWTHNSFSLVRKTQQRRHFLRSLKWARLPVTIRSTFCRSVPLHHHAVQLLQRSGSQVQKRSREDHWGLPSLLPPPPKQIDMIYQDHYLKRAYKIIEDPFHLTHSIFQLLQLGKRHQCIKPSATRLRYSFFPWAMRMLNDQRNCLH